MKSRNSRAETCPEQGESTAWLPPDRTGRPKERVRLDCERILRPERTEEKNQMGEAIRIAAPSSPHGHCGVLETGFGRDFRAAGIEQTCRAGASPKPARAEKGCPAVFRTTPPAILAAAQSRSRQLAPTPISTTIGTASLWTPSISSRTNFSNLERSLAGTSKSSSSCTCRII